MDELIARLEDARTELWIALGDINPGSNENRRVRGMIDGIRLALSYAREMQ